MLRKGTRVKELTRKVGQAPRHGVVVDKHDTAVEVEWEDGHVSSLSGAYLIPLTEEEKKQQKG